MLNGRPTTEPRQQLFFAGALGHVVARRGEQPISQAAFLHEVSRLTEELPDRPFVVNCVNDRLLFLASFMAAIVRGQITLLSSIESDIARRQLAAEYPSVYCIADRPIEAGEIDVRQIGALPATPDHPAPVPHIAPDQVVAHVFTSGSTGLPTAHVKTWDQLAKGAMTIAGDFGISLRPSATILGTVPSQHMYGLEFLVMQALCGTAAISASRPFYPWDIADALSRLPAPRLLVTTPVHLRALVETVDAIPEVARIYSAGAPLPRHVAERAERRYRTTVVECYGCTEAGSIAIRQPVRQERWRPLTKYEFVPHEGGHAVNAPFFTSSVPLPDTIDLAADGTFALTGRMGDVINIAGKRASLSGLNAILTSIDGIDDGAFCAPPSAPSAQTTRLMAFVVAPDLSEEEVRHRLRGQIDSSFLPRHIVHLSALPRRDNGKLEYESLMTLARRHSRGGLAGD